MKLLSITKFGRDHASLLAYVECRCVDHKGLLELPRLRVNPRRHAEYAASPYIKRKWLPSYATRLRGHTDEAPALQPEHDDVDCLWDLEAAHLIEIVSIPDKIRMTAKGHEVACNIRWHKIQGGSFQSFNEWPFS